MLEEIKGMKEDIVILQEEQHKIASSLSALESKPDRLFSIPRPVNESDMVAIRSVVVFPVTVILPGTTAAVASNYEVFFVSDNAYTVVAVMENHRVNGSSGSDVTLNIEKLTGTTALDSGSTILSSNFNLRGTSNTVQYGTLKDSTDLVTLKRGDKLALKDGGTLTDVAGLTVTVFLRQV